MGFFLSLMSVAGLLLISFVASGFMIVESGSFYQALYPKGENLIPLGYIAAVLSEVFMTIMAAVRLEGKNKNKASSHPANWLFNFLLVLLFILTVGGASFNLVYSKLGEIQNQKNNTQIIQILQSQVLDHEKSLETFAYQNQRVNSAITVRNQQETKSNLIKALKSSKPLLSLWFEVIFVVMLRFAVQLANLTCVWLAGWLFRQAQVVRKEKQALEYQILVSKGAHKGANTKPLPEDETSKVEEKAKFVAAQSKVKIKVELKKVEPEQSIKMSEQAAAQPVKVKEQPTRIAPEKNKIETTIKEEKTKERPVLTKNTSKTKEIIAPASKLKKPAVEEYRKVSVCEPNPESSKLQTKVEGKTPVEVIKKVEKVEVKQLTAMETTQNSTEPIKKEELPKTAQKDIPKEKLVTKGVEVIKLNRVTDLQPIIEERKIAEEKEKNDLAREIRMLLSKRNQGVTLGQLCSSLGLSRRLAEDLENPRNLMTHIQFEELESMHNTILEFYNEQSAISY